MVSFLTSSSTAAQKPGWCQCVLATQPSQARAVLAQVSPTPRRQRETQPDDSSQQFRSQSFVPPPPPPIFDDDSAAQDTEASGRTLIGVGTACLTALAFVYGFQDDNTDALRAARRLPPRAEASIAATEDQQRQQLAMEAFPTTLVPGELPVGMQPQWAHQWRYDANGQPFVKLQDRWWRLQRPSGSRAIVTFFDVQNRNRPGLQYIYTAPSDWPLDEIDLCDQRTMALLFGQDTSLEDSLQLAE